MSFFHSPRIVTDGLVLYLDAGNPESYSGSGTDWFNLVSPLESGSLIADSSFISENIGVIQFDGTDDYIEPSSTILTNSFLQANWTISFWVKWDIINTTNLSTDDRHLLTHGNESTRQGLHLTQRNTRIHFGLYSDDYQGTTLLQTNTWYNVVFTLDNTSYDQQIFLNGNLDATFTAGGAYTGGTNSARIYGKALSFGNPLSGSSGVCMAYDRVLTEQEVLQNYNALRGRFGI